MTRHARAEWFALLAQLAFPADPTRAEEAFVPMIGLMADIPDAAFTQASLQHVVTSPRKMAIPSYDEIRKPLAAWWWEQRRSADARLGRTEYRQLPGPAAGEKAPPSEMERHAVSQMVQAFKASTTMARSHLTTPEAERPTPAYLTDRQLLEMHLALAAKGNPGSQVRADHLRRKLGMEAIEHAEAAS